MLGLKRGTIKLTTHNPKWAKDFKEESKKLTEILGDNVLNIQHVGSTAIPGISAKPIIDILIGVKTLKREGRKCVKILTQTNSNYHYRRITKLRFLVAKGNDAKRTHYIHFARHKGKRWTKLLVFRDYLLLHKDTAKKYSELKERLGDRYKENRKKYTEEKKEFVEKVITLSEGKGL